MRSPNVQNIFPQGCCNGRTACLSYFYWDAPNFFSSFQSKSKEGLLVISSINNTLTDHGRGKPSLFCPAQHARLSVHNM